MRVVLRRREDARRWVDIFVVDGGTWMGWLVALVAICRRAIRLLGETTLTDLQSYLPKVDQLNVGCPSVRERVL